VSTHPATPPESEMVEALLDVLRQSHAPRTAAQLREGLPGPKLPTAARLGAILEGQVAAGAVARFDPLTGRAPRYWMPGRDEHAGLRAQAMAALRAADGPRTAAEVRKELADATVKAPALARLLEEQVAAEALVRFEPAGGTAPRYWTPGREEHHGVIGKLLDALREPAGPRTAAEVVKAALPGANKAIQAKARQLLEEQVAAGTLHRHAPAAARGAARYSDRSPEQLAGRSLLAALARGEAAKKPLTFAQLHKALKGTTEDRASELLQGLLDAGEAHKALRFDPQKPDQYVTRAPDLRAHLEADLAAIYARFARAGVSRERVDGALRAYLGAPAAAPAPIPVAGSPSSAPDSGDLAAAVLGVFEELRREKYSHTGMVPIHEIRREIAGRLGPATARHDALDDAIKRLGRERLRMLPINDASHVSAEELNDSIRGLNETWFYLESKS